MPTSTETTARGKGRSFTLAGCGALTVAVLVLLVSVVDRKSVVGLLGHSATCEAEHPQAVEHLRRHALEVINAEIKPLEEALRRELDAAQAERAAFRERVAALRMDAVEEDVRGLDTAILDLRDRAAALAARETDDLRILEARAAGGETESKTATAEVGEGSPLAEEVRSISERLEWALGRARGLEDEVAELRARAPKSEEVQRLAEECIVHADDAQRTTADAKELRHQLNASLTREDLAAFLQQDDVVQQIRRVITSEVLASHEASCAEVAEADFDAVEAVDAAIRRFAADGTSEPDFALAVAGAKVLAASDIFTPPASLLPSKYSHFLGWENGAGGPEEAITEGREMGRCFAMGGNSGYLTLQLAVPTRVHGFSVEHADASYSWNTASAPRDIRVSGLLTSAEDEGEWLAQVSYRVSGGPDDDVPPVQTFPIETHRQGTFAAVRIDVLSNHGSQDYTCLYRIRVHGSPASE